MRTSWTTSGLTLAAVGTAVFAAALGAFGFFPAYVHALLGEVGGTLLALGGMILFFERKGRR